MLEPVRMKYIDAIKAATLSKMSENESVILIGEGVPDPKAVFGSTAGLKEKFGPNRVFDMPVSENGMTGVMIGAAITGFRPIMVHQRIDFSLYAMDQIINNGAKWHSMFGGNAGNVPLTIRAIVGRGWGQGNQHSQNLAHIYASFPGIKVVCPSNANDAYHMLRLAVDDQNPVFYVEHRWLHNTEGYVTSDILPIGKARVVKEGEDLTLVAWSYMMLEALKIQEVFHRHGLSLEVIDLRSLRPLDIGTVKESVKKTKRLFVIDEAWKTNSFSSEIITQVVEDKSIYMVAKPGRSTSPDCYAPSTPHLSKHFYQSSGQIASAILDQFESNHFRHKAVQIKAELDGYDETRIHDVPDASFRGPF